MKHLYNSKGFPSCPNKIVGQFPDLTVPRLTLPWGQIPDWHLPYGHLPNGHIPDRTIPRLDISAIRHFSDRTFPRLQRILKFLHFLAKLFFEADGLDFPLIFSWFIILSILSIYTQLIYKTFNLLKIACKSSATICS